MKAKVIKYSVLLFLVIVAIGGIYYLKLPNRHRAIIKTKLYHQLNLVDNTWSIRYNTNTTSFVTPTLMIDNIYKSMEGPKVMQSFQLNPEKSDLVFISSFKTKALSTNEVDQLSNDYICHTNVDFYDGEHYTRWQLNDRIGQAYPRLTSMSNGIEAYEFPKGFGFPVFANENLFLSTQTLNHNITNSSFSVKHEIELGYRPYDKNMKPLMSKTVFIMLPYDKENPFEGPTDSNPNMCLPVETKNHSYLDADGNPLSGHWVIFPGQHSYKHNITSQLQLQDSTRLHHIAVHLHPFAKTLALRDITKDSTLFISNAENYDDKIGLKSVSHFSSEAGIKLYPNHDYELVLETDNTSGTHQDMMASMFLFLYDAEMHEKLKTYTSN